jgi:uncharacterized protein (DUF1501 family)
VIRDPRFITIVLRGGLDGLATVVPVGDPDWLKLRGDNALIVDGPMGALPLDGFFALNPGMPNFHRLYQAGQAVVVHAVASAYRDRSHFDGQAVLESGFVRPGRVESGWLNRALASLETDGRADRRGPQAFAIGPIVPLIMRGPAPVLSWVPPQLPAVPDATTVRLLDLYRRTDANFRRVLEGRLSLAAMIAKAGGMERKPHRPSSVITVAGYPQLRDFAEAAGTTAKLLARPEGPRIGALAFDGWDTHVNEGAINGRLASLLAALDGALEAIETNMGDAWSDTIVAVITEFGRTARINGGAGTDHGTGTVLLLAGGTLKGGRVIADWPGLKDSDLLERRDLRPTTDLRAVLKGVLWDHLGVPGSALDDVVFPDGNSIRPMTGLLR